MLGLSRKPGESITYIIPPSDRETTVTVTFFACSPARAKVGSDAPREVKIVRTEKLERKAT